jgi:hypothetical protein
MPLINTVSSHHAGPAPNSGWQWLPFPSQSALHTLNHAIHIINSKIKGSKTCDAAFKALPGGRTFVDVWADHSVWISYDPGTQALRYGATLGKEVTITAYSLRIGYWTVAATLIHELAHVDGAPGGNNHDAEATLRHCLLSNLEDPNVMGSLFHPSGSVRLA